VRARYRFSQRLTALVIFPSMPPCLRRSAGVVDRGSTLKEKY
jgi:hypothetical protein